MEKVKGNGKWFLLRWELRFLWSWAIQTLNFMIGQTISRNFNDTLGLEIIISLWLLWPILTVTEGIGSTKVSFIFRHYIITPENPWLGIRDYGSKCHLRMGHCSGAICAFSLAWTLHTVFYLLHNEHHVYSLLMQVIHIYTLPFHIVLLSNANSMYTSMCILCLVSRCG